MPVMEVRRWSKLGRRITTELRTRPDELTEIASDDFLTSFTRLLEGIERSCDGETANFRLSSEIDNDQAEFLLHGIERCLSSERLRQLVTETDVKEHSPFTLHLVESLTTGLVVEGRSCEHYLDDTKALFER